MIGVYYDLYDNSIFGFVVRTIIKKYNLSGINVGNSNLHYDKKIHLSEAKVEDCEKILFACSIREMQHFANKINYYLLLTRPDKFSLLFLRGFHKVFTFNDSYYEFMKEEGLTNVYLLKAPRIELPSDCKKIIKSSQFFITFLTYNGLTFLDVAKIMNRDLNVGFLFPTQPNYSIVNDIQLLKHQYKIDIPCYIKNIAFSKENLARIIRNSHIIIDETGFFKNLNTDRSYVYLENVSKFPDIFSKSYRNYVNNQRSGDVPIVKGDELEIHL